MIEQHFITTGNQLEGYRVVRNLGIVRGIIVRSRSAIGNFAAGIQTFFGGNITLYTQLCEQAREEAFDLLRLHAFEAGANAIIAMRYESNDVASGVTEVLTYGTAVVVERVGDGSDVEERQIESAETAFPTAPTHQATTPEQDRMPE
ncbi:MAG: YbjQ family protein [Planctomycetes bacterium]|nr:YbjQ family protein [Planctomycetota bacterium]